MGPNQRPALLALATQPRTGAGATALMIVGFVTVYLNPAMPSPTYEGNG